MVGSNGGSSSGGSGGSGGKEDPTLTHEQHPYLEAAGSVGKTKEHRVRIKNIRKKPPKSGASREVKVYQ